MIENNELAAILESHVNGNISAEAKTILQDAIYRIKNIGKYISNVFKKGITLTVQATETFTVSEKSLEGLWKNIIAREKDKKNPEPWFDDDILGWFDGKTMPSITAESSSTIQRFTQTLTHAQILQEAENLSIKKIYSWLEAIKIIEQAVLMGEVDVKGLGVIVYFKIDGDDTVYRFYAGRSGGGRLSVSVNEYFPSFEWDAGDGASFSN